MLYGATALHPATLAAAALLLVAVSAVAAYFPARRASRANPVAALTRE